MMDLMSNDIANHYLFHTDDEFNDLNPSSHLIINHVIARLEVLLLFGGKKKKKDERNDNV